MRIISDFHDYYDTALAVDTDQNTCFIRNTTLSTYKKFQEEFPDLNQLVVWPDSPKPRLDRAERLWVFFCGKCYPAIGFWRYYLGYKRPMGEFFYDFDSLMSFVESPKLTSIFGISGEWEAKQIRASFELSHIRDVLKTFLGATPVPQPDELFRGVGSPAFLFYGQELKWIRGPGRRFEVVPDKMIVNPCLKDFSFARHLMPFIAYQEIDMYLNNQMVNRQETGWTGDDVVRAEQHGFNKWSFRNPSPGGKSRKQKK